jgi:inner membrane protein
MMGRSHVLLGAACYVALWSHPLPTPLGPLGAPVLGGSALDGAPGMGLVGLSLVAASASALAPDIDKAGSTAARAGAWATRLLAWSLEHTVRHRGPLHSLLALVVVVVVGNIVGLRVGVTDLGAVIGFGWAAHLLGDVDTTRGIPLLWPLRARVRPPVTFATGTWQEALVLAGALAVCLAWAAQDIVGRLP